MTVIKNILTAFCALICSVACVFGQGHPVIKNFTEKDYNAHSRNFDIEIDSCGRVWVANFEGLLYYDNAQWRILYTPGFTRVTSVFRDSKGTIWAGGYNYMGRVIITENGTPTLLKSANTKIIKSDIVKDIWESEDGTVRFITGDGNICHIEHDSIVLDSRTETVTTGLTEIIDLDTVIQKNKIYIKNGILQTLRLDDGYVAQNVKNEGIKILKNDTLVYTIDDESGMLSNNTMHLMYNKGILWGACEKCVFAVQVPSPYTFFYHQDGLQGMIQSIEHYDGVTYVGTNNGCCRLNADGQFEPIANIPSSCWDIGKLDAGIMFATSTGIYDINGRQYTSNTALTFKRIDGKSAYVGCIDGIYLFRPDDKIYAKICPLEKVSTIQRGDNGDFYAQSIFGHIWHKAAGAKEFVPYDNADSVEIQAAAVVLDGNVHIINATDKDPIEYPLFSHYDNNGITWLTDNSGKNVYCYKDGGIYNAYDHRLYPIKDLSLEGYEHIGSKVWFGYGDNDIVITDLDCHDPAFDPANQVKIRSVIMNGDSVVWGGFGQMPSYLGNFEPEQTSFKFVYSVDNPSFIGKALYQYRLNGSDWSQLDEDTDVEYLNLHYGDYTFEVQALTAYGVPTAPASVKFSIKYPWYRRWYAELFYALLLALAIYAFMRRRVRRLRQEKIKLEQIVQERTAEIATQRDEIQLKSESLENALAELSNTQRELIRQEKMATAGKLTQGLIDRILNPLNYINNFSKLSIGLVGDIAANIEDDKDKMDEENYEDTVDVLEMLKGNLQKVADHGLNTTRTLKAMEELLKDRTGGMVAIDIKKVLKKNEEVVSKYHESCINQYGIKVTFDLPEEDMPFEGNPEQLSKTFMSIINNGFYAVVKKAEKIKYTPEVRVSAQIEDNGYIIKFYDNGIGIEQTITDKVFDPFFTTKPTGEAAGVGLYLSREIIQNHHGEISVTSEKDKFSEFTVEFQIVNSI